jgi:hypothetical protein
MILALFLCSFLLVGCSKEDEEKELNTFFEGIVINSDTDEPLSNTQIELIGYPWVYGLYDPNADYYTRVFQVNQDGTFNFSVTTTEVKKFEILLQINNQRIAHECSDDHPSVNGYCSLIEPGKAYTGIQIFGNPNNPQF